MIMISLQCALPIEKSVNSLHIFQSEHHAPLTLHQLNSTLTQSKQLMNFLPIILFPFWITDSHDLARTQNGWSPIEAARTRISKAEKKAILDHLLHTGDVCNNLHILTPQRYPSHCRKYLSSLTIWYDICFEWFGCFGEYGVDSSTSSKGELCVDCCCFLLTVFGLDFLVLPPS